MTPAICTSHVTFVYKWKLIGMQMDCERYARREKNWNEKLNNREIESLLLSLRKLNWVRWYCLSIHPYTFTKGFFELKNVENLSLKNFRFQMIGCFVHRNSLEKVTRYGKIKQNRVGPSNETEHFKDNMKIRKYAKKKHFSYVRFDQQHYNSKRLRLSRYAVAMRCSSTYSLRVISFSFETVLF